MKCPVYLFSLRKFLFQPGPGKYIYLNTDAELDMSLLPQVLGQNKQNLKVDFSSFLIKALDRFPIKNTLCASHKFGYDVFSLSYHLKHFLISTVVFLLDP